VTSQVSVQEAPVELVLCGCGHRLAGHDAIAARYCSASTSGGLERGCVCGPPPPRRDR
jgi:hypothetical protein